MKGQEKTQKEWIWEEKGWKDWWEEFSEVVVSDRAVAEIALERAVERVAGKKMAEKVAGEAAEELRIQQIQVSTDFHLIFLFINLGIFLAVEFGEVNEDAGAIARALERQRTGGEFCMS